MNKRLVLKILGATLLIEAATMLPSYVVALVYHDPGDGEALLKTILMMVFLGLPMWFLSKPRESNLRAREGFVIVALAIMGFVVALLRSRKLREKYAALWVLVGLSIVVLALVPDLL